jgi:hypothetical protein
MLGGFSIQIAAILFLALEASKVSASFLDVIKEICHWKVRSYYNFINLFTVVSAVFFLIAGPVAFKINAFEVDSNAKSLEPVDDKEPEKIGQNLNLAPSQRLVQKENLSPPKCLVQNQDLEPSASLCVESFGLV